MCRDLVRMWLAAVLASLLVTSFAHAAAPTGAWWNTNFPYRYKISIAAGASALATGYSVALDEFNHASEVAGTHSLANGNDVRVVYWNGSAWIELNRVLDSQSSWNTAGPQIWFKTQAAITLGATDDNYYIYYGDLAAGTPPADENQVFALFDGFTGSSVSSVWTNSGATVSAGVLTVPVGGSIRSVSSFGQNTMWEASLRLPSTLPGGGSKFFYYWMANSGGNDIGFFADTANHYARAQAASTTQSAITTGDTTSFRRFGFARDGMTAVRYFIDGTEVVTPITTNVPSGSLQIYAFNDANGNRTQQYDWVRLRAYRNPEPDPGLSTIEQLAMPTPVAEWRLDETSWTSAAGQVLDSGSNALHGQAYGATTANTNPTAARTGDPGTCRYGSLDGVDDYVQIPNNAALNMTSQVSVSAWVYPRGYGVELKSIVSKDDNYEFHVNSSGKVYWWWGGGTKELTSSAAVPLNTWSHIVISYQSGAQRLYVNGVLQASGSVTGALTTNSLPLQIGQDQSYAGRYWNGAIDEVRVYSAALNASQVQTLYQATHPCSTNAGRFVITHDGTGVNCAPETIAVSVRDINNNPLTTYSQQMTLNTQSGRGTWSLISGTGSLTDATANDGVATYQWTSGQSTATFALSYPEGSQVLDIDAYQTSDTTIRDDDSEGTMTFAQSQFVITSSALSDNQAAPFPTFGSPQTAGTAFPIHIAKYGATQNNANCHIVTDYQGTKSLAIWSAYVNPSSGSLPLIITAGATTANVSTTEGANTFNVGFVNGRAQISGLYRDAGRISLSIKDVYEAALSPVVDTRGSSGPFVVQPAYFSVAVTGNPGAVDANGAIFTTAGDPFAVTVTARDSNGNATPNYGRESIAESVVLVPTVAQPVGASNGTVSGTFSAFNNGVATSTDTAWSEAGIVRFTGRIRDGDYLGSGDIPGIASGNIGRFKPADFMVSMQTGTLGAACGAFSYLGQPLKYSTNLVLMVTARNRQGATTTNYRQSFFKLDNASVTSRAYSLLNDIAVTHAQPPATEWSMSSLDNGTATLTFTTGATSDAGLVIAKTSAQAPFDAQIQLKFSLADSDTVAAQTTPVVIGAGTGIPFINPEQRYGRLAFRSAIGSERVNLPMPLHVEYYADNATGFRTSTTGTCATPTTLAFSDYAGHLQAGEVDIVSLSSPPLLGDFNLILQAPGEGNDGKVKVEADVPAWLQIWNPSAGSLVKPWGIATFGLFQGSSRRVYQREVYSGAP